MRKLTQLLGALALSLAGTGSAFANSAIPLIKGLSVVYEGYFPGSATIKAGYLERVVTVSDLDPDQFTLQIQFNDYIGDKASQQTTVLKRPVRTTDLDQGHRVINQFLYEDPPILPGSVYIHFSKAMLQDLMTTGTSHFVFGDRLPDDNASFFSVGIRKYFRGDLKKVERDVHIPVVVNGKKVDVPALHVSGNLSVADISETVDFWISTDPENPLLLREQRPTGNYIQLVQADVPQTAEQPEVVVASVEAGLAGKDCRANLPGIYFGTDSDVLLPASQPALKQIGDVLLQHADWKITIEGNTDNTGTPAHNLDLSQRRAAAVKNTLVTSFHVGSDHLATTGNGETRPVDSNETPEGRAANRRVEASRSCS
jgi:outer membrane protein OmpA-like peptidoglycan-associated protein